MAQLELCNVVKRFGSVAVIHGIELKVEHGELVVFVGPSGCGKSTLLRMIAGLEPISEGKIFIDGDLANDVPAARRGVAMVFQSYALYPHMSVYRNMAFGLETARLAKAEIEQRVQKASSILRIGDLLSRKPRHLSGGQRQRVAIGRAIVREPRIFLFDEPLSNLDADLRVQMRVELTKLHRALGATMIYVTHDQTEAMTMADRIVVLNAGRVEQVGSPLDICNFPVNRFVAGFVGSPKMNFLEVSSARVDSESVTVDFVGGGAIALPISAAGAVREGRISLGIRPEHLMLADDGEGIQARVALTEQLGDKTLIYAALENGQNIVMQVPNQIAYRAGTTIGFDVQSECCHVFGSDGRSISNHRTVRANSCLGN
jgi:multiple sugar transport system ATP-binding protein